MVHHISLWPRILSVADMQQVQDNRNPTDSTCQDEPCSPEPEYQGSLPSGQPWASGRVLAGAQRDRKRALDRISGRKRRHQAAKRITDLESKVNRLTADLQMLTNKTPERTASNAWNPSQCSPGSYCLFFSIAISHTDNSSSDFYNRHASPRQSPSEKGFPTCPPPSIYRSSDQ